MSSFRVVAWTAGGQALTAVGVLVGQRLITELVTPATYGEIVLLIGAAGLIVNLLCTPLTQAAIHQFPACQNQQAETLLKKTLSGELFRVMRRLMIVGAVATVVVAWFGWFDYRLIALLVVLITADTWRTSALALTNAAQKHRRYATWVSADAWLRGGLAVVAISLIGAATPVVIAAYVVAVMLLTPLSQYTLPIALRQATPESAAVRQKLWSYAAPLVPLGLIGWVTGLADRYVIGATLSIADAGLYAAAAGLASRPILMLGTAIELIIRPKYQQAVSGGDAGDAARLLRSWLLVIFSLGGLLVVGLTYWRQEVTAVLLGAEFRSCASLLPWIAAGYLLLIASYVFERVCYAHGRTRRVLFIQTLTATAAVVSLFFGAYCFGVTGAAFAVPVYYSVQLLTSIHYAQMTNFERVTASVQAA